VALFFHRASLESASCTVNSTFVGRVLLSLPLSSLGGKKQKPCVIDYVVISSSVFVCVCEHYVMEFRECVSVAKVAAKMKLAIDI